MKNMLACLLALLISSSAAWAEVTLPSVIADHMVMQRDTEVRVWGKADPGERITVVLTRGQGDTPVTVPMGAEADEQGRWSLMMKGMPAGGPYRLTITGSATQEPIVVDDVLFGEVWVASGQSNMQWTVRQSANPDEEIANSNNDQIRMWTATRTVKSDPAFDVEGGWAVASPQTTGSFSAVGYYFARHLQQELGVPVGILHSSWGGTPVEAWTSRPKLESIEPAGPILKRFDNAVATYDERLAQYQQQLERWRRTRSGPANTGFDAGYANTDFDDAAWQTMTLPQRWEDAGLNKDGVVWFRRTIDLPQGWAGQALTLNLGPIDDGDTTYVNGTRVGGTEPYVRNAWQRERTYRVPARLVEEGKLTITVRVVDMAGTGGVWGKPDQMTLARTDGEGDAVSLAGDWRYKHAHGLDANSRPGNRPNQPFGPEHPHAPAGLFNGMIQPIVSYTIQGAIWYQGESNAPRAQQYRDLFPGMIHDWRERWGQGEFPFLFVQLANYRAPTDEVVDHDWAHLRDAQFHTLRTVPNTGMATIIDIGEANDIHPKNKQDVGLRLALWALADTYEKDVVKSGPIYASHAVQEQVGRRSITIVMQTFGSRLRIGQPDDQAPFSDNIELQGFTIAGEDGKYIKANASIVSQPDDATDGLVSVWSDQVPNPVAVRYAWENNPDEANLVNEEGLPASPFRTDEWPGPTDGRR